MRYLDKTGLSKIFIVVFHIVGLIGFVGLDYKDFFLSFVPFHLLLMGGILIANQKEFTQKFWVGALAIIIAGITVEIVGVATGSIFGNYTYGNTLGYKLADVPLIIGINWFILVFSVGSILKKYFKHQRNLKSLIGAFILVLIDVLIEPVAIKYDYWSWQDGIVPLQNFVAWFIVSFVMLRAYYEFDFRKTNKVAATLLICQTLFFIVLNLTVV
ncbi:carotenoid biosynthesis protein [Pelobium sp.]|nr:carotenoid biosynthesis protein [Pelobium sp.]MDA9555303.1 carotenoid biosynthesis protein [Pelobium sp.]